MGTHPNTMLILTLMPDNLARKTFREIQERYGKPTDRDYVTVGGEDFSLLIMEADYDEGFQLSAPEGSIVLMDMVTYGRGQTINIERLVALSDALRVWAGPVCEEFKCSITDIRVGANYW